MLSIRIQGTPNPRARKYILSEELKAEGKVSYQSTEECEHVPLAHALMSLEHVTQVHFFENVLTLTQDGTCDWALLDDNIQQILEKWVLDHDIFFDESTSSSPVRTHSNPELAKIDAILETTIRPALQMDGGDIELVELEQSVLSIRYMGACGGCPSAMAGTLQAITSVVKSEYNENIQIVVL